MKRICKIRCYPNKTQIETIKRIFGACRWMDKHPGEEPKEYTKNLMKGVSYNTSNIKRLYKKFHRLYEKRTNYGRDKILKFIKNLVRTKPEYITIEDLDVSSMLENDSSKTLHDYIAKSKFYFFKERLISKCQEYQIEVRIPKDPYFASSKICSICGHKKKDLSLSDRIYKCNHCGYEMDRDVNAASNLCNLTKKQYKVIV